MSWDNHNSPGESSVPEPIAIVGMSCRLPGCLDLAAFWDVLWNGAESVAEYPGDRFCALDEFYAKPFEDGGPCTRRGGFLRHVDSFDASFFHISPREAAAMDPQHRLLLEVAAEALDDAGLTRHAIAGSRTGVFAGLWIADYEDRAFGAARDVEFHATTGGGRYSASGRISYAFDLRGPSLVVDTACSSSLVATHLACESLWSGESEMALAGGANIILRPEISRAYARAGMLSPDGRCKFGDIAADGFVRSEGAGVVVLKPLSKALLDGDAIYAVIAGSAVNNDGQSSGALVAPSRTGQEALLRAAFRRAGVAPAEVQYIEAHGTGTAVGDPVELGAIGAVMAESGRSAPCLVGSVKTNIGHTEGAAGVAGLIKVALALHNRWMPATLHCARPAPSIEWDRLLVALVASARPFNGEDPVAGVSAFGITGTNAHVVLRATPEAVKPGIGEIPANRPYLLPLSAQTRSSLDRLVARYSQRANETGFGGARELGNLCYTAACRRTHYEERFGLVFHDPDELRAQLQALSEGEERAGVCQGRAFAGHRIGFVFSGQGSQWLGMGRALLEREPVFCQALERCDAAIARHVSWSAIDLVRGNDTAWLEDISVIQPMLFAIQVALAALWRSWSIEPAAVIGHSMGEIAAACVAGLLDVEDGAAIICRRSRLMRTVRGRGAMATVELSVAKVEKALEGYEDRVSVAASNSPTSTVISGDADAVAALISHFEALEIFCRPVKVDVASHSPHVTPLLDELVAILRDLRPREGSVPMYSTVSGEKITGSELTPDYWARNLRQPVLFSTALGRMLDDGITIFIECSPHPILTSSIVAGLRHEGREAAVLPSCKRGEEEQAVLLDSLARVYSMGGEVDWSKLYPSGECIRLPNYCWEGERHWIDDTAPDGGQDFPERNGSSGLGQAFIPADVPGVRYWETTLRCEPDETRHQIGGVPVTPAWKLLDLVCEAAEQTLGTNAVFIEDVELHKAVFLPGGLGRRIQLNFSALEVGGYEFRIHSREGDVWERNASGRVRGIDSGVSDALTPAARARLLDEMLAEATRKAGEDSVPVAIQRVRIGEAGTVEVNGVRFVEIEDSEAPGCAWTLEWRLWTSPPVLDKQRYWRIIPSEGSIDIAAILAEKLRAEGDLCVIGEADACDHGATGTIFLAPRTNGPEELDKTLRACGDLAQRAASGARLWVVTYGAQGIGDAPTRPEQAPLWAIGRAAAAEYPAAGCVSVDLDAEPSADSIQALAACIHAATAEDQIAIREGQALIARLAALDLPAAVSAFDAEATYLITGGLGAVGLETARWMASLGARSLVLVSRREPSEKALAANREIEALGCRVTVIHADLADADGARRLIERIGAELPPLRGIFHAAASADNSLLAGLNLQHLEAALAGKARGAWNLHKATASTPLHFFVCFSSLASLLPQPGQGAYAAANAFADSLCAYRRQLGLTASSIQWGGLEGLGLAATPQGRVSIDEYAAVGIGSLSAARAMKLLGRVLAHPEAAPATMAAFRLRQSEGTGRGSLPKLIEGIAGPVVEADGISVIEERLIAASCEADREAVLESWLREELAAVLRMPVNRVGPEKPLGQMGLDSLLAVELARRIGRSLAIPTPVTTIFSYPTVRALARHLSCRLEGAGMKPGSVAIPMSEASVAMSGAISEEDALLELMGMAPGELG
ncbi:MAG TPA: type I polyketide synthase [Bryobacteraceae bacterium]|nr:type I polyketide synthase [Bryobacteraceae bacterium]